MLAFTHSYVQYLIRLARERRARIAVPDAQFDARCLEAAAFVHREGWLPVVLTGARREIEALGRQHSIDITGMEVIDPDERSDFSEMCREYGQLRTKEKLTAEQIDSILRDPAHFACMLHRHGVVEGVCSGVHYSTADLVRPSVRILGLQPGITKMTALAILAFENCPLGQNLVIAAADGTVIPRPTSEELADIAILAADKAKTVLPETPRVAMLSFSTLGSAQHEEVERVVRALDIVRRKRPDICIDGEFQLDTALSPYVASKKIKRPSKVAGRANVLIWPDLQTGNCAGKALLMMGNGRFVGASFLGLNGIVNDHSRGATVEEVIINIAFVGAQVPSR
jgi:phosphate acetyltransferase